MRLGSMITVATLAVACAGPVPLSADVEAVATTNADVGGAVQLVVKVTNTGPAIPHLGLVFRTADKWYERHRVTELGVCTVAIDSSAFDCGELAAQESKTFSFRGVATTPGTFHYELALRQLVQPFDYVNDRHDGVDAQVWDEVVRSP
jgi:hypothetical protein